MEAKHYEYLHNAQYIAKSSVFHLAEVVLAKKTVTVQASLRTAYAMWFLVDGLILLLPSLRISFFEARVQ